MEQEFNKIPETQPIVEPSVHTNDKSHGGQIAAIIFVMLICSIVAYLSGIGRHNPSKTQTNSLVAINSTSTIANIDPFFATSLKAKSAFVWDIKNQKVLFAKNANDVLPLASITKIMTADVASELLSPTSTISIEVGDLAQDGDTGLFLNERWTFKKLLNFTLSISSNDGASAIANTASSNFVEKMNEKAQLLGLSSMQFFNPTGLDESITRSGAYGSAADVAKLFSYTLQNHPEIFEATRYATFTTSSLDNFKHTATNTDEEINNIPGIIGSKTGYSDLAGGNLAIIYDAGVNYPIIVVVLGSTYNDRFTDVLSLIKATNQTLNVL